MLEKYHNAFVRFSPENALTLAGLVAPFTKDGMNGFEVEKIIQAVSFVPDDQRGDVATHAAPFIKDGMHSGDVERIIEAVHSIPSPYRELVDYCQSQESLSPLGRCFHMFRTNALAARDFHADLTRRWNRAQEGAFEEGAVPINMRALISGSRNAITQRMADGEPGVFILGMPIKFIMLPKYL